MARPLAALLLAIAALSVGCGQAAVEEPQAPSRTADHQTQGPRRLEQPRPRLLAPPPAYGNKVVMAKSSGATALN